MKTVTFYYVRHGQTEYNVEGRMQGWCDSPLTEKGLSDACTAKKALREVDLKRAFCSPLKRCRDTCAIVLEGREVAVTYMDGLKEHHFGSFEGTVEKENRDIVNRIRFELDDDFRPYGGEWGQDFRKRIQETFEEIYAQCEDKDNVLVVSHGAVFLYALEVLLGYRQDDYLAEVRAEGEEAMIAPNGYVGSFCRDDNGYHLLQMSGRRDDFIERLNDRRKDNA